MIRFFFGGGLLGGGHHEFGFFEPLFVQEDDIGVLADGGLNLLVGFCLESLPVGFRLHLAELLSRK